MVFLVGASAEYSTHRHHVIISLKTSNICNNNLHETDNVITNDLTVVEITRILTAPLCITEPPGR